VATIFIVADDHDDTIAHTGKSIVDVAFAPYASLSYCLLL